MLLHTDDTKLENMLGLKLCQLLDIRDNISADSNQLSGKSSKMTSSASIQPSASTAMVPAAGAGRGGMGSPMRVRTAMPRVNPNSNPNPNRATSAGNLNSSEIEARKAQRKAKREEEKKVKEMEANWRGRAGGMDMGRRESKSGSQVRRDLPRIQTPAGSAYSNRSGSRQRATTAPPSNAERLEHSPLRSPARGGKISH